MSKFGSEDVGSDLLCEYICMPNILKGDPVLCSHPCDEWPPLGSTHSDRWSRTRRQDYCESRATMMISLRRIPLTPCIQGVLSGLKLTSAVAYLGAICA